MIDERSRRDLQVALDDLSALLVYRDENKDGAWYPSTLFLVSKLKRWLSDLSDECHPAFIPHVSKDLQHLTQMVANRDDMEVTKAMMAVSYAYVHFMVRLDPAPDMSQL